MRRMATHCRLERPLKVGFEVIDDAFQPDLRH
jgi:hypothetical protein